MTSPAEPPVTAEEDGAEDGKAVRRPSRRSVLGFVGGGLLATGFAAGAGATAQGAARQSAARAGTTPAQGGSGRPVPWRGASQAGVDRPWTPQRFCLVRVLDWPVTDRSEIVASLAALGRRIAELATSAPESGEPLLPDGARDLTVTVGLGSDVVRRYDEEVPGSEPMPAFSGDEGLDPSSLGGDVLLLVASEDPVELAALADALAAILPGASTRWEQRGYRGPSEGPRTRNPFGFHDGVIVPHSSEELDESVWFGPERARATLCVVRRFELDTRAFRELPLSERERAIGRDLQGRPLSGGAPFSEADLLAKLPDGEFEVPLRSHLRAAHPSFTGSGLMLRRSYAYDAPGGGAGLLFISYQRELRTFVETLRRMEEVDDAMMRHARATGGAAFLILPGFDEGRGLGEALHPDDDLRTVSRPGARGRAESASDELER